MIRIISYGGVETASTVGAIELKRKKEKMDNIKLEFIKKTCGVDGDLANRLLLVAEIRSERLNRFCCKVPK